MSNPHYLTLGQAAKLSEVAKSTITRAINKGQLSAAQKVGNSYRIDPAELQRWQETRISTRVQLPVQMQHPVNAARHDATPKNDIDIHIHNAQLEAELTALKQAHEQIEMSTAELKAMTDKMLSDKDREIERLYTLAITDQRARQDRGFWAKLFGAKVNQGTAA